MKKLFHIVVSIAIPLLGISAMFAETFSPSTGWIIASAVPALFITRYLTAIAVSELPLRRSPLYGPPDRRFPAMVLGVFLFFGSYLFVCMFSGMGLTIAFGESHQRLATVSSWDPHYRKGKGHYCTRIVATIETPERRSVGFCLSRSYPFVLGAGSAVFLNTQESVFGHLVEANVYLPKLPRPKA